MSETETTDTPGSEPAPAPLAERPWPRVSRVRMAVPVVIIVAALVAAGIVATVNESNSSTPAATPTTSASGTSSSSVPITYATAAKEGKTSSYNWGSECDHHTGRLKMPTVYSPPCVPVPTGSNGGATSSGVTATSINLVYYQPQPGGLASTISGAAGTPAQALATVEAYVAMLNKIYVMYGRHVNLIPFRPAAPTPTPWPRTLTPSRWPSRTMPSPPSEARARRRPTRQELARLHVLCMVCGDSTTYGQIQQNAPYQWANLPTADTSLNETVGYIVDKLNGKDADLGRRPVDAHAEAFLHRRERDLGAACSWVQRADRRRSRTN